MWDNAVITNAGEQLLTGWLQGTTLSIEGASAGSGVVSPSQLRVQTALVNEKKTLDIIKGEKIESGIRMKLRLTSEDVTESFVINQIGIYARLENGSSTLISLYQDSSGIQVPTEDQMPDFVFTFWAVVTTNNEGTLSIEVAPATQIEVVDNLSSTSTEDALSANQGKVLNDKINRKVNASEKGEAEGIATLDAEGKIPEEQLPGIGTLEDVNITAPTDKQVLVYNADTEKWENGGSQIDYKLLPATDVTALAGDATVGLSWVNPGDVIIGGTVVAEYNKTRIVRKAGSAPTSPSDGTLIYDNNGTSYTDSGLVNDTTYYYAIYPYSKQYIYSDAVTVSAIPTGTTTITILLVGAKEDTITIKNANGETVGVSVFASGQTSGTVEIEYEDGGSYSFESAVAKDTVTGTSNYSRSVVITDETEEVKVMPDGALYWYGWQDERVTNATRTGTETAGATSYRYGTAGKSIAIDLTSINTIKARGGNVSSGGDSRKFYIAAINGEIGRIYDANALASHRSNNITTLTGDTSSITGTRNLFVGESCYVQGGTDSFRDATVTEATDHFICSMKSSFTYTAECYAIWTE